MEMRHWHIASGLAGYGPDGADGYGTATDTESLCDAIRSELALWVELEMTYADAHADAKDYEAAWKLRKHSDQIDTLYLNFDPKRADAPLYKAVPEKWAETVEALVGETFPYPVSEGRSNVYVWLCETAECEHLAELTE